MPKTGNPWTVLGKKTSYENDWIEVEHHDVLNPAGKEGIYGVVRFKNLAVGILPVDDELNTWLIGQYRYPLGQYSWEIPEGGSPLGSDPLETAKRELREETGIEAKEFKEMFAMHLSNSVTNEYGIVYLAKGLKIGEPQPDEEEELILKKIPLREAISMGHRGEISDSLSLAALMKAELMLLKGEL